MVESSNNNSLVFLWSMYYQHLVTRNAIERKYRHLNLCFNLRDLYCKKHNFKRFDDVPWNYKLVSRKIYDFRKKILAEVNTSRSEKEMDKLYKEVYTGILDLIEKL